MTLKEKIDQRLQRDGSVLARGYHLDGAGPARFGWVARYPTGRVHFLGKTLEAAATKIGIETR